MGYLSAVYEEFGEDVVIISISTDLDRDTVERLKSFREDYGIVWTIARDTEYVYWYKYGEIQEIPTLILIDREGIIRYRHVGLLEEPMLSEKIIEIPEFPAVIVPLLFMSLLLVAVVSGRAIRSTRQS